MVMGHMVTNVVKFCKDKTEEPVSSEGTISFCVFYGLVSLDGGGGGVSPR